jgi:hypothetical protein
VDEKTGRTLNLWSLMGSATGAILSLPFLPFVAFDVWFGLFSIYVPAGYTVGLVAGFLKVGGEV